ncbi:MULTISPECIES: glycosyltransferase family 2 protein [unclassified Sphingobium]|uniref:glycosyltransferase family 2 protein n=1 Tax=unclassified Sphingobium TaxID=2611147 RepID=UPI0007D9AD3C|nr:MULTISPECIES: glycosyltransferase family 2 protein [unclassified Sphingobium]OAP29299.1 glycosyl hydrolase [Sphingobium sp. 20006FA]
MKTISIVTPCFNEADNVELCRDAVASLFAPGAPLEGYGREHIFADNDSHDGTQDILRKLASTDPCIKVILNARNYGPFRSNFNALRAATGDAVVVFLPADLQDPAEMIPEFVKLWESGIEVVAGARVNRQESVALRTCRAIFYRTVRSLSDIDIPVNVGEFQLLDRKVWEAVVCHDDHYPYIRGIIASVGFRRVIVPYTWTARRSGISKNNLPRLIDQALNGIFSFTNVPMRLCTFAGAIIAVLCLLYVLMAVGFYVARPDLAPRGTMTLIVALFFLSGIQLTFLGILGEYVTSIHAQVRKRPLVVERERINMAPSVGNAVHKLQHRLKVEVA